MILHNALYALAFLGADSAAMGEQEQWFVGRPEENFGLAHASDTEAYGGHLGKARELYQAGERSSGLAREEDGDTAVPTLEDQRQTPDETMRLAYRQIETALIHDLLERIRNAPPDFFERLMVNLLICMGYGGSTENSCRTLGRSGDDGVDGVVDQDALGLDRVYIQAKRYASGNNIGPGAIRDFFRSLDRHKATKGLFVAPSTFSSSKRRLQNI